MRGRGTSPMGRTLRRAERQSSPFLRKVAERGEKRAQRRQDEGAGRWSRGARRGTDSSSPGGDDAGSRVSSPAGSPAHHGRQWRPAD